jgi:hypothetical protein
LRKTAIGRCPLAIDRLCVAIEDDQVPVHRVFMYKCELGDGAPPLLRIASALSASTTLTEIILCVTHRS